MYLECTCYQITEQECETLMRNKRRICYNKLIAKIKKEIPELYNGLCLNLPNPYSDQCGVTDTHYILVHSAIEYFIRK